MVDQDGWMLAFCVGMAALGFAFVVQLVRIATEPAMAGYLRALGL